MKTDTSAVAGLNRSPDEIGREIAEALWKAVTAIATAEGKYTVPLPSDVELRALCVIHQGLMERIEEVRIEAGVGLAEPRMIV